jgi:hypothetical protein
MNLKDVCALPDDNELTSLIADTNRLGLGESEWVDSTALKPWVEKQLGQSIPQIPEETFEALSLGLFREAALRWLVLKLKIELGASE